MNTGGSIDFSAGLHGLNLIYKKVVSKTLQGLLTVSLSTNPLWVSTIKSQELKEVRLSVPVFQP